MSKHRDMWVMHTNLYISLNGWCQRHEQEMDSNLSITRVCSFITHAIYSAASPASAEAASERCVSYLGVSTLAASLNWVDLAASELTLAAARAAGAAAIVGAAGGTTSLAALLAGIMGVNLALGELCRRY